MATPSLQSIREQFLQQMRDMGIEPERIKAVAAYTDEEFLSFWNVYDGVRQLSDEDQRLVREWMEDRIKARALALQFIHEAEMKEGRS